MRATPLNTGTDTWAHVSSNLTYWATTRCSPSSSLSSPVCVQTEAPMLLYRVNNNYPAGYQTVSRHRWGPCINLVTISTVQGLMQQMLHILTFSAPRSISCDGELRPVCVFTDGTAEGPNRREVTVGAVIADTAHATPKSEMCGAPVPESFVVFVFGFGSLVKMSRSLDKPNSYQLLLLGLQTWSVSDTDESSFLG